MDEIQNEPTESPQSLKLKRIGSLRKQPYYTNLRLQLTEQLRNLDTRVETQVLLSSEIQDFFRKRAEIEYEYGRSLDKLGKALVIRQKELKQKRDQVSLFSLYNCWQQLITETKQQSHEHSVLGDIYSIHITSRLGSVSEDLQRIYKQCREIGVEAHEELLKVLHELYTSTKTYHSYQGEYQQAESKLNIVEGQKKKLESGLSKEKIEKSKKIRLVDKEIQKRKNKYTDTKFKALKAKNEYLLCMDAANIAIQKYFVDDLSDLIDCMDIGFYQCITRSLSMYISSQDHIKKSISSNVNNLTKYINSLDSRLDKQKFLETNTSFIMPKKFEFQPLILKGDDISSAVPELETCSFLGHELESRRVQLSNRLSFLRVELDELWKTLESTEESLKLILNVRDFCTDELFRGERKGSDFGLVGGTTTTSRVRIETEDFYLMKFHDYMIISNRIARLQAKYDHILRIVGDNSASSSGGALSEVAPRKVYRKRVCKLQQVGNPKLFGGSLEEYIEATKQEIPLVIKSCIRVINLYGLHHQGIFRVSGSQLEKNNLKESFERGEDPLVETTDASDINSIAGVLKLYLRELREPLFPIVYFDQFMELAQLDSKHVFVLKIRELINSLPRPVFVVLRYLFGFLNHLSEYSDENMMDPYNLAICFGPTLLPIPDDKDQVQFQNLVNELIKNIIIYTEDIFSQGDGGVVYEKYLSKHLDEVDVDTPVSGPCSDPMNESDELLLEESDIGMSEDDSVFLNSTRDMSIFEKSNFLIQAQAQYDFNARSSREVSFKKGENIELYSQVSSDWWKGSVNGTHGLIPDKYIFLKIKDEDKRDSGSVVDSLNSKHVRLGSDSTLQSHLVLPIDQSSTSISLNNYKTDELETEETTNSISSEELSQDEPQEESEPIPIITPSQLDESIETKIVDDLEEENNGLLQESFTIGLSSEEVCQNSLIFSTANEPSYEKYENDEKSNTLLGAESNSKLKSNIKFWESRCSHATPDLVMDLPSGNQSPLENNSPSSSLESPTEPSTAEVFAKQQNTLKKNSRDRGGAIGGAKPEVKLKPNVKKKPNVPPQFSTNSGASISVVESSSKLLNEIENEEEEEEKIKLEDEEKSTNL